MKTSKLTKFLTKNNVKKLSTKQTTKVSGQGGGGIATTAVVAGIVVLDDFQT